jgi:hypothetical protein
MMNSWRWRQGPRWPRQHRGWMERTDHEEERGRLWPLSGMAQPSRPTDRGRAGHRADNAPPPPQLHRRTEITPVVGERRHNDRRALFCRQGAPARRRLVMAEPTVHAAEAQGEAVPRETPCHAAHAGPVPLRQMPDGQCRSGQGQDCPRGAALPIGDDRRIAGGTASADQELPGHHDR